MKFLPLSAGILGVIGMPYLIGLGVLGYYEKGFPSDLFGIFISYNVLLFIAILLLFYFGLSPGLRRARFKIYENGFVPHYVPLKYCLRKDDYFIPWEKVRFGTFFDPAQINDPMVQAAYKFQKIVFRKKYATPADHYVYYLSARKAPTYALSTKKETNVRVAICAQRFVGPNEEKLTSEDVMKILKEKVKIEEKVKMVPFEEFVQRGGMMGLGDS
jgi:hypothetical protein